jgi:two-component system response regulator
MSSNKVILLIEDNPSDVELTKRALAKSRIANELVVAEDGEAALEYLWREGPYELPALALLDLNLPRLSGIEVLRRIRAEARTRRLPVVILTSSKEEQDLAAGYDLGVNSYIRKPVDFNQFVQCIEQLGLYWLVLNEQPPAVK